MQLLAQVGVPSEDHLTGFRAIIEGNGIAITITGLLIVFAALTAISLFIGALPILLRVFGPYLPEIESPHDQPVGNSRAAEAAPKDGLDPRLVAAIGWAMHASRQSDR